MASTLMASSGSRLPSSSMAKALQVGQIEARLVGQGRNGQVDVGEVDPGAFGIRHPPLVPHAPAQQVLVGDFRGFVELGFADDLGALGFASGQQFNFGALGGG